MPWIQTEPEMERRKFVQAALRREESMRVLCQRFGISRKTGDKMLARHAESGLPGSADASRAPKVHPNQTPPEQEAAILRGRLVVRVAGGGHGQPLRRRSAGVRLASCAPRVAFRRCCASARHAACWPATRLRSLTVGWRSRAPAPSAERCGRYLMEVEPGRVVRLREGYLVQQMSPMCPDTSVTHVPGCTTHGAARRLADIDAASRIDMQGSTPDAGHEARRWIRGRSIDRNSV
ncbi:MAG: hypothetical protein IPK26_01955 [Planctomycetes bacterium]|nr:hypothetical protein [Planctomycetota bacterium]